MAIWKDPATGECATSTNQCARPGCYADERAARFSFRFSDPVLLRLQDAANKRGGPSGGAITWEDLKAVPVAERGVW